SDNAAESKVVFQTAVPSVTSGKVPPAATAANAAMDSSAACAVIIGVAESGASAGTVICSCSVAPGTEPVSATDSSTVCSSMVTSSAPSVDAVFAWESTVQDSET